ncbi:hypothetical protein J8273_8129 [Carpediemonas membranifera]|uniref:Uncharacterized protein n=1 Tax=Carpediemonas membranifera TaxID=201153 RepID=A0A8J6B033_9EUKA|nr:hypothetical protein J8273_8129 [Carpediemonas membranifera]|eukprot:KAG9390092.1 hypothetical protein J8273_8129 [Carpediemonas membranifera]
MLSVLRQALSAFPSPLSPGHAFDAPDPRTSLSIQTVASCFAARNLQIHLPQTQFFQQTTAVDRISRILDRHGHSVQQLSLTPSTVCDEFEIEGRVCTVAATIHGQTRANVPIIIMAPEQFSAAWRVVVTMAMLALDSAEAIVVYRETCNLNSIEIFTASLQYDWLKHRRALLFKLSFFGSEAHTDAEEEREHEALKAMACDVFSHTLVTNVIEPRREVFPRKPANL